MQPCRGLFTKEARGIYAAGEGDRTLVISSAKFAAMRRASFLVSSLAAERRCGPLSK